MKHLILATLAAAVCTIAVAQQAPRDLAYSYMRNGDYPNAILVLNKALQSDADNQQLMQDLALAYFYKKDYARAKEVTDKLIDRSDAEVVSFQVAGNVFKALELVKDAEKMYKKALRKHPDSGPLHNEYGELLFAKEDFSAAIRTWEKGIEVAPSYPGNYYNAANFYHSMKNYIWALVYGEIFANMEYLTERGTEMRKKLLSIYRDDLFQAKIAVNDKSEFAKAVANTFEKQKVLTGKGLTVEALAMIRTKFVFDWFSTYANKFPYRLFDYHQQLIKEGMFDAYNQWLFGTADNLAAFDQWSRTNNAAYSKFDSFQKGRVFKMPAGQYYQKVR